MLRTDYKLTYNLCCHAHEETKHAQLNIFATQLYLRRLDISLQGGVHEPGKGGGGGEEDKVT